MGESEFWAGLATIATLFAGAGLGGRLLRWTEGKLEAFFAASAKADKVPAPEREESLASLMFRTRPSLLAGLGVVVWGWALWEGRRRGFDEAALEKGADGIQAVHKRS